MKLIKYSLTFFILTAIASCKKKDPVPCFTQSAEFVKVGDVINFTNCSTDFDKVEWNFGDGGSSTISDPSHKWDTKGFYTVVLNVFKGSVSKTISKTVIVDEAAHFQFSANFSAQPDSTKYGNLQAIASLYRASDLNTVYQTLCYNLGYSFPPSYQVSWNPEINGMGVISENSTFRIKIRVVGTFTVPYGSNGFTFATEPVDSLVTDVINTFTGPKTATGSALLKPKTTITYTIGPVSIY